MLYLPWLFLIASFFWFFSRFIGFYRLETTLKKQPGYNSYLDLALDDDRYCFTVKLPTFLYWKDGNLSITKAIPEDENENYRNQDSMIIWLSTFSFQTNEVGVVLIDDTTSRQVYLKDAQTAVFEDDQPYLDRHQKEVQTLIRKAENVWGIKMPWEKQ